MKLRIKFVHEHKFLIFFSAQSDKMNLIKEWSGKSNKILWHWWAFFFFSENQYVQVSFFFYCVRKNCSLGSTSTSSLLSIQAYFELNMFSLLLKTFPRKFLHDESVLTLPFSHFTFSKILLFNEFFKSWINLKPKKCVNSREKQIFFSFWS